MGALKSILDDFARATGLTINYHKSTFVPMNIDAQLATEMASTLGCGISQFSQPYLGLPLSPHKLRVWDFQPLVANFDRYLSDWKARLLSIGGRLILVNAVLGSLATYYMSSTLLPKTVIEALEQWQPAFLWTGEEKCHNANCLIAWERVCQEKDHGGLGICSLKTQNHRLLLKLVHKLHTRTELPWQVWFR